LIVIPHLSVTTLATLALSCVTAAGLATARLPLRRFFDVIGAVIALILLLPLLLGIAAAIKATSAGPVLVRSRRYGRDRKTFMAHRFRTTEWNASTRGVPQHTAIGRFLEKHSLHELPLLIDVIAGKVSLFDS